MKGYIPRIDPIPIKTNYTGGDINLASPIGIILVLIGLDMIYFLAYLVVSDLTNTEYKDFTLFGKIIFFPLMFQFWLFKKAFIK